jgi:glucose/arabinose dehydrogenase
MSRTRSGGVRLVVALLLGTLPAAAQVLPYGLKIEKVLDSGAELAAIAQSPTHELWLAERATGTIRLLVAGVEEDSLTLPVQTSCDSGLLDLAFAPDYPESGRAFVSFVDTSGSLRVEQIFRGPHGLTRGPAILDLGTTPGCRAGGGMDVGPDGKLYVGVGDLEVSSTAQNDSSPAGKILRTNFDGSIPVDNPDPASLVFAKGFRDPRGLDINPNGARAKGTLYASDLGSPGFAADEINVVATGGNYGWDTVSGDSGGTFDDPLVSYQPTIGPIGLVVLQQEALGSEHRDSLVYTDSSADELRQAKMTGSELDLLGETGSFFDPDGDTDGTPDSGCPHGVDALLEGADGMLYAANDSVNPGIWRVYRDLPGPREVSPPGSPFSLWARKQGSGLVLSWEKLSPIDSGRPARHGGQHAEIYRIYEGSLPINGSYDHLSVQTTNGTPEGPALLSAAFPVGSGSHYYLVSAQGDNLAGSTGRASSGALRNPVSTDYCATLGYGKSVGQCIDDFRNPNSGEPMKLIDYNPLSPTYLQALSVREFRGNVVHIDIAAFDCFWCNLQAPTFHEVDLAYRDRDFILLTVLNASEFAPRPYADADACAAGIASWVGQHNEHTPVLCDVDFDQDGLGDVSTQFWHDIVDDDPCGGFSQNFFIDQGGVIFAFGCSFTPGTEVSTIIEPEVNQESCE